MNDVIDISFDESGDPIEIQIGDKFYQVSVNVTIHDVKTVLIGLKQRTPPVSIVATMIQNHIIGEANCKPTIKDIIEAPNVLAIYEKAILENNVDLNKHYSKLDDLNTEDRFINAIKQQHEEISLRTAERLSKVIPQISIPTKEILGNIAESLKNATDIFDKLLPSKETLESINKTYSTLFDVSKVIEKTIPSITDNVQAIITSISGTIGVFGDFIEEQLSHLNIPYLSQERIKQTRKTSKKWGQLGWTLPPDAPVSLFVDRPEDERTAQKAVIQYCSFQKINEMVERLSRNPRVNKADIEEALTDYKSRNYKSCALLLFSMIDASLIRMQRKEDKNQKGERPVGNSAVCKIATRFKKIKDVESKYMLFWIYENVFSCLGTMFSDTNDFKKDTKVINRNYICHGMAKRRVRKKDCIQLFLLYYNLRDFLDMAFFNRF